MFSFEFAATTEVAVFRRTADPFLADIYIALAFSNPFKPV